MGSKSRLLETLPNFLLFFLFACCMFFVLLSGAKLYQNVSGVMEKQFSVNTCISYMTAKARHYDTTDSIALGKIGDTEALLLKEEINNEYYVTYLYCHEGNLMELFCKESLKMEPESGQIIMPLDTLTFSLEEGFLSFSCEAEGEEAEAAVYLQGWKGAAE